MLLLLTKFSLFSVISYRLFDIQITNSSKYKTLSKNNQINVEILYPVRGIIKDRKGNIIASGRILYSKVLRKNGLMEMYLFNKGGKEEYYDKDGKSIRKTLMKTPIDGARLSSGFGNRRHPVLGYNKMHKGIDFAARKGTPIYAAGDGIIERANFYGGYGRYIRIRHNSQYKTAYAHLSKFAKKIKKNAKVKQGDIIGYVGTSGRSTGPHLHYEVLFNQKQINPNTLKMPEVEVLSKNELVEFNKKKIIINDILIDIKNWLSTQTYRLLLPRYSKIHLW